MMERQKPKREHRSWLTLDNLFNGLDNETLVGEPTEYSNEYEIDPNQVPFEISTMEVDGLKYCHIKRKNGTAIAISPSRWSYSEENQWYTFMVDPPNRVPIPTWQEFYNEENPETFKTPEPDLAGWEDSVGIQSRASILNPD